MTEFPVRSSEVGRTRRVPFFLAKCVFRIPASLVNLLLHKKLQTLKILLAPVGRRWWLHRALPRKISFGASRTTVCTVFWVEMRWQQVLPELVYWHWSSAFSWTWIHLRIFGWWKFGVVLWTVESKGLFFHFVSSTAWLMFPHFPKQGRQMDRRELLIAAMETAIMARTWSIAFIMREWQWSEIICNDSVTLKCRWLTSGCRKNYNQYSTV